MTLRDVRRLMLAAITREINRLPLDESKDVSKENLNVDPGPTLREAVYGRPIL